MVVVMAKPAQNPSYYLRFFLLLLSLHHSNQLLQPSQSQTLLRIQQLLNYPSPLSSLNTATTADFCNIDPTPSLTLLCFEDNVTQLHIAGINGFPSFNQSVSATDSFFAAVSSLSGLKVLSLASLGLEGPVPATIGQLSSLEILNLSSNTFTGAIPGQLSSLRNLQTLVLDHNMFSGKVPGWISLLPNLAVLSLKNNLLSGYLPNSLTSLENLRVLSLSKNYLSGEVPDLHNLTNLQVLDLEGNHFGPHFPGLHNKLVTLVLRNNSFRFGVPGELETCYQLQKLDISLNGFVGPLLPSLFSLPSITYLDVSQNKFTGMLFENMSCNDELSYVDMSSNFLIGDLPICLKLRSKSSVVLYTSNCLSNKEQEQHPSNFCHNEALAVKILPRDKEKHKKPCDKAVLASSTMGGTIAGIAIVSLVFLIIRRVSTKDHMKKPQTRLIMENASTLNAVKMLSDARYISQTMKLGASLPAYRTFALEELKEATNNFDTSNLLAEGNQIYRGKLSNDTLVAIRSLTVRKKNSQQALTHHIESVSKLRHSHLISSLGHCLDPGLDDSSNSRIFLIFEFIPNGTLRDHISGVPGKKLSWPRRIGAAIGVARGIQFLHTGIVPGVFSNNLKITDVLLDHDLNVKIGSYNLPLISECKGLVGAATSPQPKKNFCESEMHEKKKDVYDLGVIILEVIVGRPIISSNDVIVSKDILQASNTEAARRSVVDPANHKECSDESLRIMMEMCIRCLSDEPATRPSVEDVLWYLQFAAQVQESWKGDSEKDQEFPVPCSQV